MGSGGGRGRGETSQGDFGGTGEQFQGAGGGTAERMREGRRGRRIPPRGRMREQLKGTCKGRDSSQRGLGDASGGQGHVSE